MLAATNWLVIGPLIASAIAGVFSSVGYLVTYLKNQSDTRLAERKLLVDERSVAVTEIDKAIPGFSVIIEQQRVEIVNLHAKVQELEDDRTRDRVEIGRMAVEAADLRAELVRLNAQLAQEVARREKSEETVGHLQSDLGAANQRIAELEDRR